MNSLKKYHYSPIINVTLFSTFWALEIFVAKLAFSSGAEILPFSLQSFSLTLLILSVLILPSKWKKLFNIKKHTLVWVLIANAILLGIGGFLASAGLAMTTAINAAFLTHFSTVATVVIAFFVLKEKINTTKILSIILILIGSYLLVTGGAQIAPQTGDILVLLACIAWALGAVINRRILKKTTVDHDIISLLRPVAGIPVIIFFIILSPLYPQPVREIFQANIFQLNNIGYVILHALFISLTWIYANRSLKSGSASYMVMMSSITPIIVTVLAMVFLSELVQYLQFIGIILILASGFLTHLVKTHEH